MKSRTQLIDKALKRDAEITCSDFKGDPKIVHLDWSVVHLNNGLIEDLDEGIIVVFSEHHLPITFYKDDLESYGYEPLRPPE